MNPRTRLAIGLTTASLVAAALAPALRAQAAPQALGTVALAAEEPTPPNAADTGALGVLDLTADAATGAICVRATISGLSGPVTMAHIHSGAPGVNGPVFIPLPVTPAGVEGCVTATPAQAQSILATPGAFYFNAHTAASPDGALRGQLTPNMYAATLSGAAEAPGPGDPDGSGSAVVAVDTTNNRACVAFSVANIDLPASMAHLHSGSAGAAGPVVVPLNAPAGPTSGSCGAAAASIVSAIVAAPGNHYANVHNASFPNGAVRGQLAARAASVPAPGAAPTTIAAAAIGSTTIAPTTTSVGVPTTTVSAATTSSPTSTVAAAIPTAAPAEAAVGEPTFTG